MYDTAATATGAGTFAQAADVPDAAANPHKHVRYNLGMVLGVADFTQEFAYLSHRDRWAARDLIGYGTACGLAVAVESVDADGPRVRVGGGAAVTPRGQLVRVASPQCAYLNAWLAAHQADVAAHAGAAMLSPLSPISPPDGALRLYVVLCYRRCATDAVPIPGEPCRCEEETTAPSRWADDFELQLRFSPPDQAEEDALRRFVAWLAAVDVGSPASGPGVDVTAFLDEIRAAARLPARP